MKGIFAKTCTYALLIALLAAGVIAVATNSDFALAQQPCQAQLGSPNVANQQYSYGNYYSGFEVTLPVSASCSFYAGQLYAVGTAYDTTYNTNIGTANAVLTSTYGGYGYTGQLTFNLPVSVQSHSVQFSVSIYGSQNGYYNGGYYGNSILAQTTATYAVGPSYYQGYPTYPYYQTPSYPSYPTYPSYPYNSGYPYYPYYPGNGYSYYYHYNNGYNQHYCRSWNSHNTYCTHTHH